MLRLRPAMLRSPIAALGVPLVLWASACTSERPATPPTRPTAPTVGVTSTARPARPALSEEAAEDTLARVIRQTQLTTLRPECYSFEESDSTPYEYSVREVHNRRCGGDPNTAPRIFDIRLDPATGAVLSDKGPTLRGEDGMDTVRRARTSLARAHGPRR